MKDFEAIYTQYYQSVFRYLYALCKEEDWAEELTQQAFFQALKYIHTFRGECQLRVWLCQIAKNLFYTEAKRRKRGGEDFALIPPSAPDLEEALLTQETAFELHRLLHQLDEPYKEVFWMRTFGELSFAQIARLWEKSESWARVTYHRAKLKIREGMP